MITDKNKIREVLTRGVESILPDREELIDLMSKRQITLYQGFDPSMPSLHLGNLVGILKLSQFQKLGHKVIFLVGDFTGMIGDPTDKIDARKNITRKEVLNNAKTWRSQVENLLDFTGPNKAEFLYNSKWLDKLNFGDLIKLASHFTVLQLLERDMYQERIKKNAPIYLHEFLYPLAQGYDSVEMNVDLEIGGSDQVFNMLAGRSLIKTIKNKEKFILSTKLLVDKDNLKVGKTTGNALFLNSTPEDFYGGIMSFPDDTILLSYELLTDVKLDGLSEKIKSDPLSEKKKLAFEIVKKIWGKTKADNAKNDFENKFQKRIIPDNIKSYYISNDTSALDVIINSKIITSRSAAKRLFEQQAVEKNGNIISTSEIIKLNELPVSLKIGKKIFLRLVSNKN